MNERDIHTIGQWACLVLVGALAVLLCAIAVGQDLRRQPEMERARESDTTAVQDVSRAVEALATCLSGEAGIKPVADHPAILHALHRMAQKRGHSVERVTRGHCNASVSARGVARVQADRLRYPQAWEALVQYVEAFDADTTPNPCKGATTWGGYHTDVDKARIDAALASGRLVRVVCEGETRNAFFREAGR